MLKFYFASIISVCSSQKEKKKEGSGAGSVPLIMDLDPDSGGPKTCGSGSPNTARHSYKHILPPQDGIYEEFVEKAAAKAAARTVGDPWSAGVQQGPQVGYSDFHNLMGFISKKMPNNIL